VTPFNPIPYPNQPQKIKNQKSKTKNKRKQQGFKILLQKEP